MYEHKCISEVVGDIHAVGPGGNEGGGRASLCRRGFARLLIKHYSGVAVRMFLHEMIF